MISFPYTVVKLFVICVTVNALIAKISWGFKDVCVFVSYGCDACKWDR